MLLILLKTHEYARKTTFLEALRRLFPDRPVELLSCMGSLLINMFLAFRAPSAFHVAKEEELSSDASFQHDATSV